MTVYLLLYAPSKLKPCQVNFSICKECYCLDSSCKGKDYGMRFATPLVIMDQPIEQLLVFGPSPKDSHFGEGPTC